MQGRDAGNVTARLADRIDTAKDDILDGILGQIVAAGDGLQGLTRQRQAGHLVQGAIGLAAAAGRAHRVIDKGFGH